MSRVAENLCDLITGTPMLKLSRFGAELPCELIGKLEAFNPGWSVKDRIGFSMIDAAEKAGKLRPGGVIVEPTSGNTGIGLAMVAAVKGYKCILTMPSSMSVERRKMLQALGAELVLTDGFEGIPGAIREAETIVSEIKEAFMPQQFNNPANPEIHYRSTGPEIWNALEGKLDVFVAGVGTGGTVSGVGRFLKEQNPNIKVVAVEPEESPVLSGGKMGPHMIQGIGAGFVPGTYDDKVVDDIISIHSFEAIEVGKRVARTEGFICGISSGAAVAAAAKLAADSAYAGKRIAVMMPDTGERYISTLLFYED